MPPILLLFCLVCGASNAYANDQYREMQNQLRLNNVISEAVFDRAMSLHESRDNKRPFVIIDYSQPSSIPRMAIIDGEGQHTQLVTHVTHGVNTGYNYAKSFSNIVGSKQTSLGIFKTAETYYGRHGYSLRLDGLSETNNKARERYIVLHGAQYARSEFADKMGFLGRSWGCPAVPDYAARTIIDLIKDGSYIYAFNSGAL